MSKSLLPNKSRAKASIFIFWLKIILSIAIMGSALVEILHQQGVKDGTVVDHNMGSGADAFFAAAFSSLQIVSIVSGIIFLCWYYRAYRNIQSIVHKTKYTSKFAIICWFIPLVNMYVPRRIIGEMWNKAEDIVAYVGRSPINRSRVILNVWGSIFILSIIVTTIVSVAGTGLEATDQIIHAHRMQFFNELTNVIAAFVTIQVIRRYSQKEDILASLSEEELFYVHELYRLGEATNEPVPAKA